MKPSELSQLLVVCRDAGVTPFVWGNQGIGKSQIVKQYADSGSLSLIDLRLSLLEPGDLIGMPQIIKGRTVFAKPSWFPEQGTKGVLFLDELNRAADDILQAVFQLVLDRRINGHILPDGWQIVCAGNYGKEFIVSDLDPALKNRFLHVTLSVDTKEWFVWANKKGFNKELLKTLQNHDDFIIPKKQLDIKDLQLSTTPRSFEMMNRIMQKTDDKDIIRSSAYGLLSYNDAVIFMQILGKDDFTILSVDDIFDYNEKKISKAIRSEESMSITGLANSKVIIELNSNIVATKRMNNLFRYLLQIPRDSAHAFLSEVVNNSKSSMTVAQNVEQVSEGLLKQVSDRQKRDKEVEK